MPKATGIDHIAIYFSDMNEAKRFFLDGLGLTPDQDYDDEFFMKVGSQTIAIFRGENKEQSINHLAFVVDDSEEVKERLKKLGYKIYKEDMVDGPNGIRIQLVS